MIPSGKSEIGYNMNDLYREAQYRWLRPAEVFYILQNHENSQLSNEPPQVPPSSGSVILFNKRVTRFFRCDGHNWRKKKDKGTIDEGHEKLKVGNVKVLNCYYAHGEERRNFQRRSYWMLDPSQNHIVLVHYRDINEVLPGKSIPGSIAPSPMLNSSSSTTFYPTQNQCSTSRMTAVNGSYLNHFSPGSVEVSCEVVYSNNASDHLQGACGDEPFSFQNGLQNLRAQLSLDDDIIKTNDLFIGEDVVSSSAGYPAFEAEMANQQQLFPDDPVDSASYKILPENSGKQDNFINHVAFQGIDENGATVGEEDSLLKELLESWVIPLSSSGESMPQGKQGYEWSETTNHQVENFEIPAYPSEAENEADAEYYQLFDQFMAPEAPYLTISEAQKYTIQDISPEWAYSCEATKVIIVGSFLCNSSVSSWMCMFGEVEVPVEIIKDGVLRCEAPPCSPGRVTLCITTGNRESCSQVREFEYRAKSVNVCAQCKPAASEPPLRSKDLQVLVRTVRLLLSDLPIPQEDSKTSQTHQPRHSQVDSDSLNHILKALKDGTADSSQTTSLLLNELLKDSLYQWLSIRTKERGDQIGCSLSKEEQGLIHLVAALGIEWALKLILDCGVNVNFRDIYGQTPLHWAALFGREKMVAALIACGAFAGAVTDPSKKDPTGQTAASIAASNGFQGLAGYLSEVALTTHLSCLTLQECELSRGSAELEAERTISSVSGERIVCSYEDQLSLQDSLAAVRSAALAAARIQSAFRVHSFRKRMQREGGFDDDYGISGSDIQAISRIASSSRDRNSSALSIQKKYRGWKGRKDFLAVRQKVVKIQAHMRGYQVRKNYKVFCWAVGVLDRVILRWRRKGIGLRNFLNDRESKKDSDHEEEDILKLFRKQNMDRALDEAVSRVLSMVETPDARQQYRRLLESYRKTKAERSGAP